jgi:hypothetical protein
MSRLRLAVIAAILAATVMFVIGTVIERVEIRGERATAHREVPGGEHGHESGAENEAERHRETPARPITPESGEELFGINPESTGLVLAAALISVALALAVGLLRRSVLVPIAVLVVMLPFAALDIRELVHQLQEARSGLATLAGVIAALHIGVAAGAVALLRQTAGGRAAPASEVEALKAVGLRE